MQSVLRDVESMIACGRMDLPISLCFAAARGDELLLQHLLRRGAHPNEPDMNGRTALVCNTTCVKEHIIKKKSLIPS